jgi:hypothetical protein
VVGIVEEEEGNTLAGVAKGSIMFEGVIVISWFII